MINKEIDNICQIIRDNQKINYILCDENQLNITGYKVLQNQEKNGFIRGIKTNYNGKTKLVYDISDLKPVLLAMKSIDEEILHAIMGNFINIYTELKENGFIQCENVSLAPEDVFIDMKQYKVYVVYLPIRVESRPENMKIFEDEMRALILKVLLEFEQNTNIMLKRLKQDLVAGVLPLDTIQEQLCNYKIDTDIKNQKEEVLVQVKGKSGILNTDNRSNNQSITTIGKQKRSIGKLFGKHNDVVIKEKKPSKDEITLFNTTSEGGVTELLSDCVEDSYAIVGVNTPKKIQIIINKVDFVIGKSELDVDGAITFNKAISRKHCIIHKQKDKLMIEDLGSLNGTYLNGDKLIPNKQIALKEDDKIRLANSEFVFRKI